MGSGMAERKPNHTGTRPLNLQKMLCIEYYLDGATQIDSMRKAGYAETTCKANSTKLFQTPLFKEAIDKRKEEIRQQFDDRREKHWLKYELTEDWVIQRMMRLANSSEVLSKFKKVQPNGKLEWDFTGATEEELAAIDELTVITDQIGDRQMKVSSANPVPALSNLMRKMGMFKDTIEIKGELSLVERLNRGREQARLRNTTGGEEDEQAQ